MWDTPESRDHGFNRFARREVTKAARSAEYWSSDVNEYALPDPQNRTGFQPARLASRSKPSKPSSPRPPAPPPIRLPPSKHRLPEMIPFKFGTEESARPQTDLGLFTNSSTSSLAMMKSLGLPCEDSPATSPSPYSSPQPPSVSTFQNAAMSSMSDWKDLGPPDVGARTLGEPVQLAKGTKRLGMGRPAPWGEGTKRPRAE